MNYTPFKSLGSAIFYVFERSFFQEEFSPMLYLLDQNVQYVVALTSQTYIYILYSIYTAYKFDYKLLCSGTHWCLHRHFQHLTKSGCCPHMLQSYHHHSSPEEVISILLQWLPSSSTHSYSHEVLWTASHATHQICPPPLPGPLPVCI